MKNQLLSSVACLLVGIGIGYYVPSQSKGGDGDGDGEAGNSRALDRAGQRVPEKRNYSGGEGDLSQSADQGVADELVTVPTKLIREISGTPPVGSCREDLFRRDDLVERLLKITAHEKEQMVESWETTRKKVEDLESRTSRSTVSDDGSVDIEVPDLSKSLRPVGDAFAMELENVLGPERSELFVALKQLDRVFTPESGPRKYHIAVESVGDGRWRYHMTYEDEKNRRVWVGDSVPNEIRHITDAARIQPSLSEINDK